MNIKSLGSRPSFPRHHKSVVLFPIFSLFTPFLLPFSSNLLVNHIALLHMTQAMSLTAEIKKNDGFSFVEVSCVMFIPTFCVYFAEGSIQRKLLFPRLKTTITQCRKTEGSTVARCPVTILSRYNVKVHTILGAYNGDNVTSVWVT